MEDARKFLADIKLDFLCLVDNRINNKYSKIGRKFIKHMVRRDCITLRIRFEPVTVNIAVIFYCLLYPRVIMLSFHTRNSCLSLGLDLENRLIECEENYNEKRSFASISCPHKENC